MTTNQQELIQTFEALPAEAQRQALNFIAFFYIKPTNQPLHSHKKQKLTGQRNGKNGLQNAKVYPYLSLINILQMNIQTC